MYDLPFGNNKTTIPILFPRMRSKDYAILLHAVKNGVVYFDKTDYNASTTTIPISLKPTNVKKLNDLLAEVKI
jgi:hypothetical protein